MHTRREVAYGQRVATALDCYIVAHMRSHVDVDDDDEEFEP